MAEKNQFLHSLEKTADGDWWAPLHQNSSQWLLESFKQWEPPEAVSETYVPIGFERPFLNLLDLGRTIVGFLGPGGVGKSAMLRFCAQRLSADHLVLYSKCGISLSESTALLQHIDELFLQISKSPLTAVKADLAALLAEKQRYLYVVLDDIHECESLEKITAALDAVFGTIAQSRIRVLFTCNDLIWPKIEKKEWGSNVCVEQWCGVESAGGSPTHAIAKMAKQKIQDFSINVDLGDKAISASRIPAILQLYCKLNQGNSLHMAVKFRFKYLFDRYFSAVFSKIAMQNPQLSRPELQKSIEQLGLKLWEKGSYVVIRDELAEFVSQEVLEALGAAGILLTGKSSNAKTCFFSHQFMADYCIARGLYNSLKLSEQESDALRNELYELFSDGEKRNALCLVGVFQMVVLFLEYSGKTTEILSLVKEELKENFWKYLLCRAAAKQDTINIDTWFLIDEWSRATDGKLVTETDTILAVRDESIPSPKTLDAFRMLRYTPEDLSKTIMQWLSFDKDLSTMAKYYRPYIHLPEVPEGLHYLVSTLKDIPSRNLKAGLLKLIALICESDINKGVSLLELWAPYAKAEPEVLNSWSRVACAHASKMFSTFLKTYLSIVQADRQAPIKITQYCLAGGEENPALALELIGRAWSANKNVAQRQEILTFLANFGADAPKQAKNILNLAKAETKNMSARLQTETRQGLCKVAIKCFEKEPLHFKSLLSEFAALGDPALKTLVKQAAQSAATKK